MRLFRQIGLWGAWLLAAGIPAGSLPERPLFWHFPIDTKG